MHVKNTDNFCVSICLGIFQFLFCIIGCNVFELFNSGQSFNGESVGSMSFVIFFTQIITFFTQIITVIKASEGYKDNLTT